MRRSKTEPVEDLVHLFLRNEGIETPYNQFRLIKAWEDVMGEQIARFTGKKFIKNQTLFVEIKSPVIKHELSLSHKAIAHKLNEKINAQVITDVIFI